MKKLHLSLFSALQATAKVAPTFCILLFACCFLPGTLFAQKRIDTQTEIFTKDFTVNAKDIVKVNANFTKVIFQEWDKNEIEFTTTVKLKRATEKDMERLLNGISITYSQSGKKTNYKIKLSNNLKINNYEITLLVKMPKDIFIDIESSFSNVEAHDIFNDFNANMSFGNLQIENLHGKKNTINIKHGKIKIGQVTHIEGKAEFSTINIRSLKYSCVFTNFSFSKITIDEVLKSFTNIVFSTSHSTINLNIPQDQSFTLDYSGSFTKFKDQDMKMKPTIFEAGNNSLRMSGFYGSNHDSGRTVKIQASFGSVSLF